jgi:hypothetical protein
LRQITFQTRILGDLDGPLVGPKTRARVEAEGARVVEGAGVHPQALDRRREGAPDRLVHENASPALADGVRRDAEERQFAFSGAAEVEFEEANVAALDVQGERRDRGMADDRPELIVRHDQPAEPQPRLADAAEELSVAPNVPRERDERPIRARDRPQGRRLAHLQVGDHRGDGAGRQVGVAVQRGSHGCFRHDRASHRRPLARLCLPLAVSLEHDPISLKRHIP